MSDSGDASGGEALRKSTFEKVSMGHLPLVGYYPNRVDLSLQRTPRNVTAVLERGSVPNPEVFTNEGEKDIPWGL